MKKVILKFLFIYFCLFVSCQQEELNNSIFTTEEISIEVEELFIEKEKNVLTIEDAYKVSQIYFKNNIPTKSNEQRSIESIQEITNEDGQPLIYVINFTEQNGFILLSATKNYHPILAYAEEGNFILSDIPETASSFIKSYKDVINKSGYEIVDSLRNQYAIFWAEFEQPYENELLTRSSSSDIYQKKQEQIRYWTSQGYECHSLGAATSLITPLDRAQGYIRDICSHTDSRYDCMDVNILLVKRYPTQYGRLLQTNWGQGSPLNAVAPNKIAGCHPVAIAQIMAYHRWPTTYSWGNIGTAPNGVYCIPLMQEIYNFTKPDFKEDGTGVTRENSEKALKNLCYNAKLSNYNRNTVIQEIKASRPLIMVGNDTKTNAGHAWICEGYKVNRIQYACAMVEAGFNDYMFFGGMTDNNGEEYFFMNWGWDGRGNGWFYYDFLNVTTNGEHFNFANNRGMITASPKK